MFRGSGFSTLPILIIFLFCNSFLSGQAELIANPPYQSCWGLTERVTNKIASDNENKLFIPNSSGSIKTIDVNKNEIWSFELGGEIASQPIYKDKTLYVLSKVNKSIDREMEETDTVDYFISAINAESGISIWRKEYKSKQTPILLARQDKIIVFLNNYKSTRIDELSLSFITLNASKGDEVFERNYNFNIKLFYEISDEDIVILTSANKIVFFSTINGDLTSFNGSAGDIQTGAVFNKGLILTDDKGILYFIDPTGRKSRLKIRFGAKITHIVFLRDNFLITSLDNFIYLISADGRKIIWKKRFAGRIVEKPTVIQNAIIAFSQGDNSLYFINPDDGKVFSRITVSEGEEIIESPLILNNLIIVTTNSGIKTFSSGKCETLAVADR